ncbi:MAG: PilZ domain-containing protein [SAR324 cluster bacterium]|nr:PilZ domain-containing protein [SAR324 cluster bacterium]
MKEQRQFSRIDFNTTTCILYQDKRIGAKLMDISLKGALFEVEQVVSIDQRQGCTLEIQLGDGEIVLNIRAELVHVQNSHFGFKFESIDLDSLAHLRRLMEVNLGNTELVGQELFFLSRQ